MLIHLAPTVASGQASALAVTVDSLARDTVPVSTEEQVVRFNIGMPGTDSTTVYVACVGLGAVQCVTPDAAALTLAPAQKGVLDIKYRTLRAGYGLIVIHLLDRRTQATASATLLVTVLES